MSEKLKPVKQRIPDVETAKRCIEQVRQYLLCGDSPVAAEDLLYSVDLLREQSAREAWRAARLIEKDLW